MAKRDWWRVLVESRRVVDSRRWYTLAECAALTGITRHMLLDHVARGSLPGERARVGPRLAWRVSGAELLAWLKRRAVRQQGVMSVWPGTGDAA